MKTLTLEQLLAATGGRLMGSAPLTAQVQQVSTDSRSIQPGSLFVPLVGEQFDGHNFIPMALQAGAAGFLTAREMPVPEGSFAILVPDTQLALEALAAWYRRQFRIPVVAVTGSVGKTTTKDMIAAVLGEKYTVLKTDGNFNNNVGMPLTILRLEDRHQIAVVEMGMDKPGEIACLTRIGRPDVAVITNIGDAHIERLGSREATLRAKLEIFEGMTEAGLAVLNGDDDALRTVEGRLAQQIVWYGCSEGCDWQAESIEEHWSDHLRCVLHSPDSSWSQMIPGLGAHMVYPALTAAIVGRRFGVSDEQICRGILDFEPTKMRMAIVHRGSGITILNDTYNANPQSMRAAVDVLSKQGGRRIAVLGDMLELGNLGPALHESVGQFLGRSGIEYLVTVGELGACIADGAESRGTTKLFRCADQEQARAALAEIVTENSTILCKASRGMHFERLVDALIELTPECEA